MFTWLLTVLAVSLSDKRTEGTIVLILGVAMVD